MKSSGTTIWLNDLQYEKLKEIENELEKTFGKKPSHGDAVMTASLISHAFLSLFSLGFEMIDKGIVDPDKILDINYIKSTFNIESEKSNDISRIGRHIEKAFIQLDALGIFADNNKKI